MAKHTYETREPDLTERKYTDRYDVAIASLRDNLQGARERVAGGNWMAQADVDALTAGLAYLEAEAALWRALTPAQQAAQRAERQAYWEALERAAEALSEDDDEEECSYCGQGDHVPASGYWRCPECDAEWNDKEDGA